MRLQQLAVICFSFVALAAAQPLCDPVTQYEQNGECCYYCPPGTRMTSTDKCQDPQCQKCKDGEYQDGYTKESKCFRQQYCDENKNFQLPIHDTMKRTTCMCNEGFHCSSEACISCVPHQACKPGYGVTLKGNHSKDTVCEKCPEGTFSRSSSRTEACQKWTECHGWQEVLQTGTDTSDYICGGQKRTHVVVISLAVMFFVLGLLGLLGLMLRKRCRTDQKVKVCIELCMGEKKEPPKENKPLVAIPTDVADDPTFSEHHISQDEPRTPEEVDDLSQEISITTEIHLTDKGKFVMQDKGMKEMKSEEEA